MFRRRAPVSVPLLRAATCRVSPYLGWRLGQVESVGRIIGEGQLSWLLIDGPAPEEKTSFISVYLIEDGLVANDLADWLDDENMRHAMSWGGYPAESRLINLADPSPSSFDDLNDLLDRMEESL